MSDGEITGCSAGLLVFTSTLCRSNTPAPPAAGAHCTLETSNVWTFVFCFALGLPQGTLRLICRHMTRGTGNLTMSHDEKLTMRLASVPCHMTSAVSDAASASEAASLFCSSSSCYDRLVSHDVTWSMTTFFNWQVNKRQASRMSFWRSSWSVSSGS